jgi:hypothetical protein
MQAGPPDIFFIQLSGYGMEYQAPFPRLDHEEHAAAEQKKGDNYAQADN